MLTMTTTHPLQQALLDSLSQHKQQLLGRRVWLACSGGRDSLSLAALCRHLFDIGKLPFLPQLLHINHGMQQANSVWAEHVMAWAKQNKMPCQVLQLDLPKKTEQEARQARYQAMIEVMNHQDVLLLGHHQDDQVETVLMRLFNGAGVNGLSAMSDWTIKNREELAANQQYSDQKAIFLWRPLLTVSRQQITQYANDHQLPYIDDPTNVATQKDNGLDPQQLNDRAWMRSILLPHIIQRYPHAKQAIARTSRLMQDASLIVKQQSTADLAQSLLMDHPYHSVIDIRRLIHLSRAQQSAVIHNWLVPNDSELPPSKLLVDEVLSLIQRQDSNHQTCLYWNNGQRQYQVRRYQNKLYRLWPEWEQWLQITPSNQQISLCPTLATTQHTALLLKTPDTGFQWQLLGTDELIAKLSQQLDLKAKDESNTGGNVNLADAKLILSPLPREQKLALLGRAGRKSGKKLLQAIGQPSFMRSSVVLCSLQLATQNAPLPLMLITPEQVQILQTEFAHIIQQLVKDKILMSEITSLEP